MELEGLSNRKSSHTCLRMHMKNRFLKSVLALSAVLAFVNCSEEAANAINNLDPQATQPTDENPNLLPADEPCWLVEADKQYLIYSAGIVTDVNGNVVGTITFIDGTLTGSIVAIDGTIILKNVDAGTLPLVTRATVNTTTTPTTPASSATTSTPTPTPTLSSATDPLPTLSSGNEPTVPVASSSSEMATTPNSSSEQQQQPKSSSATSTNQCDGKCLDSASGKCVDPHTTLKGSHDEQYAYDESCKVNCYYDPTNQNCQNIGGGAAPASSTSQPKSSSSVKSSSSQQQPKSSSSQQQPKSSSSVKSSSSAKSSSSVAMSSNSQSSGGNDAEASKYIDAGKGGQQGWATRYWDCCMPSCAWKENSNGNPTKTCDAKGKSPVSGGQSICSGGQQTTCTSQIPIIASDKVAYAFAAVPAADGGKCGKCFALTFTGQGKYETKGNHQALKGKTLVVMASNIGGDVNHGQFDIMIPGGGLGAFKNGCSQMGWGNQGAEYGGLLSDCENSVGYDGDLLSKRKQCLTNKCNEVFKNDSEAKEGCLFLATWMEAAGNPNHEFKEVECPQALKGRW